jgi:uncharacterized protein YcfJ
MHIGAIVPLIAGSILTSACVAGPGGSNNAANRTITGAAVGAALGGVAGKALGSDAMTGAMVGALAGGALGAAVNPNHTFRKDTRGYCVLVDEQGRQVFDAEGRPVIDYEKPC